MIANGVVLLFLVGQMYWNALIRSSGRSRSGATALLALLFRRADEVAAPA